MNLSIQLFLGNESSNEHVPHTSRVITHLLQLNTAVSVVQAEVVDAGLAIFVHVRQRRTSQLVEAFDGFVQVFFQ